MANNVQLVLNQPFVIEICWHNLRREKNNCFLFLFWTSIIFCFFIITLTFSSSFHFFLCFSFLPFVCLIYFSILIFIFYSVPFLSFMYILFFLSSFYVPFLPFFTSFFFLFFFFLIFLFCSLSFLYTLFFLSFIFFILFSVPFLSFFYIFYSSFLFSFFLFHFFIFFVLFFFLFYILYLFLLVFLFLFFFVFYAFHSLFFVRHIVMKKKKKKKSRFLSLFLRMVHSEMTAEWIGRNVLMTEATQNLNSMVPAIHNNIIWITHYDRKVYLHHVGVVIIRVFLRIPGHDTTSYGWEERDKTHCMGNSYLFITGL